MMYVPVSRAYRVFKPLPVQFLCVAWTMHSILSTLSGIMQSVLIKGGVLISGVGKAAYMTLCMAPKLLPILIINNITLVIKITRNSIWSPDHMI